MKKLWKISFDGSCMMSPKIFGGTWVASMWGDMMLLNMTPYCLGLRNIENSTFGSLCDDDTQFVFPHLLLVNLVIILCFAFRKPYRFF